MTLVALWNENGVVKCVADTRLSSGVNPNTGRANTLIDSGGKMAVIAVSVKPATSNAKHVGRFYSCGFAFAGSTILAQNTHFIASTCTQTMYSDNERALPSISQVGEIYSKAGEYVAKDLNSREHKGQFTALIFGYCPVEGNQVVCMITPTIQEGVFRMISTKITLTNGQCIAIGSGKEKFKKALRTTNSIGINQGPMSAFNQVVSDPMTSDVGGFAQIMIANIDGVEICPVLYPNHDETVALTINGFDTSLIDPIEGIAFGNTAIGLGLEQLAGRNALRAKGIDPDQTVVTRELQNLASFEAGLEHCFQKETSLFLDDGYTLAKTTLEVGKWYLATKCGTCGKDTGICLDPSDGQNQVPLKGPGHITTRCNFCDSVVTSKTEAIYPLLWE
ncbi:MULTISPECIES: hypothetical protein [unclassified Pseudovibrio]|uniref:hypothetical protein n=1 Tax=unclassified Pseudovibrio TaxID=2627060 RepID=UPI0007B29059|nr:MULTISPECIES: hypothetical protein [unclassified Pseudovibrio]KZK97953.1 hypothetical protein PsAD5_02192 [Pseudovibrio sp. Ad5]KZL02253.1 hypothetical protein PsW74_01351 [Pseudovibrio sp. W74]KZL08203.1 hypothetical protein PsAD14_03350 [Pseudovibrio sp. Ad14]